MFLHKKVYGNEVYVALCSNPETQAQQESCDSTAVAQLIMQQG